MAGLQFYLYVIFCIYAILVSEDTKFVGNSYGWKAKNVKRTEDWDEYTEMSI